jgi:hypothetical protein
MLDNPTQQYHWSLVRERKEAQRLDKPAPVKTLLFGPGKRGGPDLLDKLAP